MSSFFEQEKEESSDLIVYSHQREKLQVSNQFLHYSLSRQCSEIQPVIYEIYPSHEGQKAEETMLFGHPEEEYLYILEGVCLLTIDDQEYTLNPGDCAYIPPNSRHFWKNPTSRMLRILGIANRCPSFLPLANQD